MAALLSCPLCFNPHFNGVKALHSTLLNAANANVKCPVCDQAFLGLDKLTIHLFSHVSIETNQQTCTRCEICNYHFSDEIVLDLHQKLLHQTVPDSAGKFDYHCHLCRKRFKKRGSLMVHLRVVHFGFIQHNQRACDCAAGKDNPIKNVKRWECEICTKLFTTKYFLKKHKRLHTGEMPYYCSQCDKHFTFQQSYHKHLLYHSNEKPHVCGECGRSFKELSTLHNHERIHSGERPFECETCGKRFRQRVSYLVHRRIHTGVMPYKCSNCHKTFRYKVSERSHKCQAVKADSSGQNTTDVSESGVKASAIDSLILQTINEGDVECYRS